MTTPSHNRVFALLSVLLPLGSLVTSAPAQPTKTPSAPPKVLSPEDKVKAEFKDWRYEGATINASFSRGSVSLLSISTGDDMEKVWKFYLSRVPTETKLPLASSWEMPDDNTIVGANYTLGSSYAVSLNSAPREAGTIMYQKGTTSIVIEIRARTPEQAKATGVRTDVKLIKMRPLEVPKPSKTEGNPVQGASAPAKTW